MRHFRAIFRGFALACVTAGAYLLLVGTVPLLPTGRAGAWRARVFRRWARIVARVVGMRIERSGVPPASPFLLVSNHLGYMDVILLASQLPAVFLSRGDVANWPVVGAMCRSVDTLFIDRDRKRDIPEVAERIESILRSGRGVVFFPEGTSTAGEAVAEFRPSLLEAAARTGRPVRYASLSYSTPPGAPSARNAVCWWGDMEFGGHLFRLLGLPGFRARLVFGAEPIVESDRKVLAGRLREAVATAFEAVP